MPKPKRNAGRDLARLPLLLTLGILAPMNLATTNPPSPPNADEADPIVTQALEQANTAIAAIVAVPDGERTFDNTLGAMDDMLVRLRIAIEIQPQFMAYVSPDPELRARGRACEQAVRNWYIELGKREDLYQAVKAYAATNPPLEGAEKKLLEETLRDYRRSGMDLPVEQRDQLQELEKDLSKLSLDFETNIRDDESMVPLTAAELAGMPEDFLAGLTRQGDLYLCGMDYPTFVPIQETCTVEATRQKMFLAYKRRGGKSNAAVLEQILKLRDRQAKMLGYANTADYKTETRMSGSADAVRDFYDRLRPIVRRKSERDFAEFQAAKREHTGDPDAVLQPWDQMFYKNHLMKTRYAVDPALVQQYFSMERVMDGLFSITQSLYGLEYRDVTDQIEARGYPRWHEDVTFYDVWDKHSNRVIGSFFLDLHPRDAKYSHAAQFGFHPRKEWSDGTVTNPLVALVCNFTKPTEDKPSLLTHDEVETFFHEFGHCLHSILTESKLGSFSGTAVARDFVEAPSQMFENWVWDGDVLKTFARHYQTDEPFPDELLDGLLKARHLGSGLDAEHQIYYGLVDFTYHVAENGEIDTTQAALDLIAEVELYEPPVETWFQSSFGHLTGYEAGYYGYLWSLVFACDMFQRFKELGMLNPDAGMYYRNKILSRGGTVKEQEMLRDYLGREPSMEAFLAHLGLATENPQD